MVLIVTNSNPLFSIIIPSYNRKFEVTQTVNQLKKQNYSNYEVIVIDDCSTDKLAQEHFDTSVTVITNTINRGAATSRNIGVISAKGKWIVFLDDDDEFLANKLSELSTIIDENPNINFIYHKALIKMINESIEYETKPESDIEQLTLENMLISNQVGGTSVFTIKKLLFEQSNGFNAKLSALEDYEFLIRLTKTEGFKPYYIDKTLSNYICITKKSSVSKNYDSTIQALEYIEKKYVNKIKDNEILRKNIQINNLKIIGFMQTVNLDKSCAKTYLKIFKKNRSFIYLLIAIVGVISPRYIILMRGYIK